MAWKLRRSRQRRYVLLSFLLVITINVKLGNSKCKIKYNIIIKKN